MSKQTTISLIAANIAARIPEMSRDSTVNNESTILNILKDFVDNSYECRRVPEYDHELKGAENLIHSLKMQNEGLRKSLTHKTPAITGVMLACAMAALDKASYSDRANFASELNKQIKDKPWLI